ncbi:hypothetical protein ACJ41O_006429 [Fusarium nematophilum]
MKLTTFCLMAYHALCVLSMPANNAAAECGDLGVMDWSQEDLPDYVDRNDLRKCKEHPATLAGLVSLNKKDNTLQERKCEPPGSREKWGCDTETGYCWMNCGKVDKGEWCWEAFNYGRGRWSKCEKDNDCFFNTERGARCSIGNCVGCGCGC